MPKSLSLRWITRGAAVLTSLGLASGALAAGHGATGTSLSMGKPRAEVPTTAVIAAPAVTVPPTTTPVTTPPPAPRPVVASTTARPRPVVTAAPKQVAAQAAMPTGTPEQRGEEALALVNYPWQQLGYTISFEPGRDGYLGLTTSSPKVIHIYVRDNETMDTLKRTIGHEMGHALDFSFKTDAERQQYINIRGINSTLDTWYGCNGCTDYTTAAGDWAETFQYWLFGPGQYWSQMGPPPDAAQLSQLTPLFTLH